MTREGYLLMELSYLSMYKCTQCVDRNQVIHIDMKLIHFFISFDRKNNTELLGNVMYGVQDPKQHDLIHPFSSILPILSDASNNNVSKIQSTKMKEKRILNGKDVVVDLDYLRRLNRKSVNHT